MNRTAAAAAAAAAAAERERNRGSKQSRVLGLRDRSY